MKKRISFLVLLTFIITLVSSPVQIVNAYTLINESRDIRTFAEISDALENPYMGWVKEPYEKTATFGNNLIFAYMSWAELEPTKGIYDFASFESRVNYQYWLSRGYKFILRFNMDYPDSNGKMDIPDWLIQEIKGEGTYYTSSSGSTKGFSPNYSNPILIAEHDKLMHQIAARYDNSNTYIMEMGSVGHWGELHTCYVTDTTALGALPHTAVESQYLNCYGKYFTHTILSCRRTRQVAINYHTTLHNDGFGDDNQTYKWWLDFIKNGYIDYYTKDVQPAYPDYWLYGPSGGEFMTWPATEYVTNSTIDNTVNQVKQLHTTWMKVSSQLFATDELKTNMAKLLKAMGYRLVLNQINYTNVLNENMPLNISMNWSNTGAAPCYFEWPMEIGLMDASGNIVYKENKNVNLKSWLPGSKDLSLTLNVPSTVPDGTYTLTTAIINPSTGNPDVKLAFNAPNTNSRYQVGQVQINRTVITSTISTVASINTITVAKGTALSSIGLPSTVNITLSNGLIVKAGVTWNCGTPIYNAMITGTYVFKGTIINPANVTNPSNLKASVNVIVKQTRYKSRK